MHEAKKRLSIKSWSEQDRPREKLLSKGARHLSNVELFAILISTGTKSKSAIDLARDLMNLTGNSLEELGKLSVKQLCSIHGIGRAKAITIAAALEIGRRRKNEEPVQVTQVNSSKVVYDYMYPILVDLDHEEFYALLLNRSNKIISHFQVSSGGVSGTLVDPRLLFKKAIEELASAVIICHNHPSGQLKPSEADIAITRKIKEGAALFEISFLDHVIFTNNSYFSFADEGMI